MNKKRLLIHAGVHQTGTALIQQFFSDNMDQLAANGVLYPTYDGAPATKPTTHQHLAWGIHQKKIKAATLKDWAAALESSEAGTIVLSGQDFCRLLDVSFLGFFQKRFEVEAVLYIRRQDDWVNSWYNLNIKWPFDARLCRCTPGEFLDHLEEFHWIRYADTADRWAKQLGKERIHIRVMERGQVEDPIADMRELAAIKPELELKSHKASAREEQMDSSFTTVQLELMRRLGTMDYPVPIRTRIGKAVSRVGSSAGTNVYSREIRQLIVDHFAAQNQKVARRYLGRSDGVLFRDANFPESPPVHEGSVDQQPIFSLIRGLIKEFHSGIGKT